MGNRGVHVLVPDAAVPDEEPLQVKPRVDLQDLFDECGDVDACVALPRNVHVVSGEFREELDPVGEGVAVADGLHIHNMA